MKHETKAHESLASSHAFRDEVEAIVGGNNNVISGHKEHDGMFNNSKTS